MTTTDQGKTVPYIVRQETGTIDRDQYRIAVLYNPALPWSPATPQDGFNHKAVATHGASCNTEYHRRGAERHHDRRCDNQTALSRGFAVFSHALNNSGHNCNVVLHGRGDDDGQGAPDRHVRGAPVHDRQRLLGRRARAVSDRRTPTRGSTRGSRRRAASPTRGRAGCCTRTTRCSGATTRTRSSWDARRRVDARRDELRHGASELRELDRLQHGDLGAARSEPQLPGRAGRERVLGDEPERRPLLAPGLHGQHLRTALAGRVRRTAVGQRPASSTAARR